MRISVLAPLTTAKLSHFVKTIDLIASGLGGHLEMLNAKLVSPIVCFGALTYIVFILIS